MINDKHFWLDCDCLSAHHAIRVWHQCDDFQNDIILEMRVNNYKGFFRRLKEAFKYVFNFNNKNCSYDSFNLRSEDVDKLLLMLDDYRYERERRQEVYEVRQKMDECQLVIEDEEK